MADSAAFFKNIGSSPQNYYIIHYSSESIHGEDSGGFPPRVTGIVVMHVESQQTLSFCVHTVAESLSIPNAQMAENMDAIELELLCRFYNFARDRREKYWIHWRMRNTIYGFEHLEHRYQILCKSTPPAILVEARIDLSSILKDRYGENYVRDPKMKNLMLANGEMDRRFLEGKDEAEAFRRSDYIRMNNSTISKVEFFHYAINLSIRRKLRTQSNQVSYKIDRLLESRTSRVTLFAGGLLGGITAFVQAIIWIAPYF